MASSRMVNIGISVDSQRAVKGLEKLRSEVDNLTEKLSSLQSKIKETKKIVDEDPNNKAAKSLLNEQQKQFEKTQKTLQKIAQDYQNMAQRVGGIDSMLQNISTANYNDLTSLRTTLTNSLKNRRIETAEELEAYRETAKRLQKVRDEILKRDIDMRGGMTADRAKEVLNKPSDFSVNEIDAAVATMSKLRDLQQAGSAEWVKWNNLVKNGTEYIAQFNASVRRSEMDKIQLRLPTISDNALAQQRKYWQEMIAGAQQGSKEMAEYQQKLAEVNDEEEERLSKKAGKVMGNLKNYSTEEIEEAIRLTEKLQRAQKPGSDEWRIYGEEVNRAKEYLQSYIEAEKQVNMEDKWNRLTQLSANALTEQKKFWQEMVNGAAQGSAELDNYQARLDAVINEENNRLRNRYEKVLQTPTDYSISEVQDATKAFEKLRDAQKAGSVEWKFYNQMVEDAKDTMKRFSDEAKESVMSGKLSSVGTASTQSLAEQKKYWQEMVNNTNTGNAALLQYRDNLKLVTDEETRRGKLAAKNIYDKVNSGAWDGTIGETRKAYEELKRYRDLYTTGIDDTEIKEIDAAMQALQGSTKQAEQGYMSYKEALDAAKDVNNFKGSIADLELLKKRLQEIKKKEIELDSDDAKKNIEELNDALFLVEGRLENSGEKAKNLDQILDDLKGASLNDLQRAAKKLEEEIGNCSENMDEYTEKSKQLQQVNKQIDAMKKNFKEKESIIARTSKRLASYVAVYASFNFIKDQVMKVVQANLALSDSLADIQKTTGLSAESVGHLSDQINDIDTRTAQQQLHELAYEAGKLGISAEEDVLAFVKAGNQLMVALGEDLGGAEAVRSLMKVNAILGETQSLGLEKALLSTGSAINEISQTSRASAGPIADMVSRMGAIGAAAGLSMADLIALAGTADALGQHAEVAATAFNKFISTLKSNPVDVAYALGMDSDKIQQQLAAGGTMQVIQDIFAKMSQMGDMASLAPIMGELGSEGARMTQVLVTMAQGVDELNAQVFTSNRAFEEATSVTNEYNIKNESAAAIVERMGNNIREYFTNSTLISWLRNVLQWLYYIPNALERNRAMLWAVRTVLWDLAFVVIIKLGASLWSLAKGGLAAATTSLKIFYLHAARAVLVSSDITVGWRQATKAALASASGINKLKIAFKTLGLVIKANPIFFAAAAIGAIAAAIHNLVEETNKATKAQAEFDLAVRKEQLELENLTYRIMNANSANGERAALIQQLNNKYGQYLGFLVTEENYIRNQEYIYKLLNAQIERSLALKMQEKMITDISEKYVDKQLKAFTKMENALKNMKGIGEDGVNEARNSLMEAIKEGARNGEKDLVAIFGSIGGKEYRDAMKRLNEDFLGGRIDAQERSKMFIKLVEDEFGSNAWYLQTAIDKMFKIEQNIFNETIKASDLSKSNIDSLNKSVAKIKKEEIEAIIPKIATTEDVKELEEYQQKISNYIQEQQNSVKGLAAERAEINSLSFGEEQQLAAINAKLQEKIELTDEEQRQYDLLLKKQNNELSLSADKEQQWKAVTNEVNNYSDALTIISKKLAKMGSINIWGDADAENLAINSPQQLVAMWDKLEADARRLSAASFENIGEIIKADGSKFKTQFWKNFDTRQEAIDWYKKQKDAIALRLKELGYNTSGNFLTPTGDGSGGSGEKEARKELNAVLAALEEHFLKRKVIIQEAYLNEKISGAEMNRQIAANDEEFRKARIELRKELVGEANTFNQSLYPELKGKDIKKTAKFLQQIGDVVTDGIRKNIQQDEVEIRNAAIKFRQAWEAEMLKGDYFGSLADNFRTSLDELKLLSSEYERGLGSALEVATNGILKSAETKGIGLSEIEQKERLSALQEWAGKVDSMTDEMLKNMMLKETEFNSWLGKLNDDQIQVLISKLREYRDSYDSIIKREAEQMKRLADTRFKATGREQSAESRVQSAEGSVDNISQLAGMGLQGLEPSQYEAEINLIKEKMSYQLEWINLLREEQRVKMQSLQDDLDAAEKRKADAKTTQEQKEAELEIANIRREIAAQTASYNLAISESSEKMLELQREATSKYQAQMTRHMDTMFEYSGQLDDFALAMGKGIYGSKEDRQQAAKDLLSSVLTTSKNLLQVWLTELATRKWIDEMEVKQTEATEMRKRAIKLQSMIQDGTIAITGLTVDAATAEAETLLNSARATGREVAKKGWLGLAVGAAISAALSLLLGSALGKVNQAKSEISSATGAGGGKLATGMLTYAEGNYPVLGNDGQVYNAKYEGAGMKTGIYRGGAHFGIFSEKKPEAIIDGDTTQRLIMNHPDIWKAIVTLSNSGRLPSGYGMRTFATGNINELTRQAQNTDTNVLTDKQVQMESIIERNNQAFERNNQVLTRLSSILSAGIHAKVDMYGNNGMFESMQRADRFANRTKMKKQ